MGTYSACVASVYSLARYANATRAGERPPSGGESPWVALGQRTGDVAPAIFGMSIVWVLLIMAQYESWIRPLVIVLAVPCR
jgi:multidrug efflux pump subunit AcrB